MEIHLFFKWILKKMVFFPYIPGPSVHLSNCTLPAEKGPRDSKRPMLHLSQSPAGDPFWMCSCPTSNQIFQLMDLVIQFVTFLGWWVHVTLLRGESRPPTIGDEKVTNWITCDLFFRWFKKIVWKREKKSLKREPHSWWLTNFWKFTICLFRIVPFC